MPAGGSLTLSYRAYFNINAPWGNGDELTNRVVATGQDAQAGNTLTGECEETVVVYVASTDARTPTRAATPTRAPTRRYCCKCCRTGKACGDTCINRSYTCWVGRGCACNWPNC